MATNAIGFKANFKGFTKRREEEEGCGASLGGDGAVQRPHGELEDCGCEQQQDPPEQPRPLARRGRRYPQLSQAPHLGLVLRLLESGSIV